MTLLSGRLAGCRFSIPALASVNGYTSFQSSGREGYSGAHATQRERTRWPPSDGQRTLAIRCGSNSTLPPLYVPEVSTDSSDFIYGVEGSFKQGFDRPIFQTIRDGSWTCTAARAIEPWTV